MNRYTVYFLSRPMYPSVYKLPIFNPGSDCDEIQANWRKLAAVEAGTWIRTYFNEEKGVRYCIWMAPSEEALKNIFTEIGISWDTIIEIEETIPDLWGEKWNEHLVQDAAADTLGS